jgi:PilZ domain
MSVEGENNMASFVVRASNRRAIRHAVDLSCSVVREKDSTLTSLRAIDLSPDGMRVELYGLDVDLGDRFFVCFRSTQFGIWFYTDATATRILHGRRPKDQGRGLGLRFGSLSALSRLMIRGALRRVPPHLPQREARVDYAATIGKILAA